MASYGFVNLCEKVINSKLKISFDIFIRLEIYKRCNTVVDVFININHWQLFRLKHLNRYQVSDLSFGSFQWSYNMPAISKNEKVESEYEKTDSNCLIFNKKS